MHFIQSDTAFRVYILSVSAFPGNGTHDIDVASAMLYTLSHRDKSAVTQRQNDLHFNHKYARRNS